MTVWRHIIFQRIVLLVFSIAVLHQSKSDEVQSGFLICDNQCFIKPSPVLKDSTIFC
uniref:Uncharacterized protein n=1 Tax=Arundo donax TaxID=35708 RepID=A0A0A8Z8U8_ARUDO